MKKIVLGISIEATKMHESIGDTSYVNETKRYTKRNQCKATADKDNIAFIDNSIDMLVIGGNVWVIEEVSNRNVTIAGYDNHRKIQEKIRIGNGVQTY